MQRTTISATSTQLRSAKREQLSTVKPPTSQLRSSANVTRKQRNIPETEPEDTVSIQDNDVDDPLQAELQQQQHDVEEDSSDEEDDDGLFENMVGAIDIQGEEEVPGLPLTQIWADKINLAWKTKIGRTAHNSLLQKYKTPSNLDALKVPTMNNEIWKLCNKWQKKADLNMSASQRTLIKVVAAVLELQSSFTSAMNRATRQVAMQTTADVVALLGKVNR